LPGNNGYSDDSGDFPGDAEVAVVVAAVVAVVAAVVADVAGVVVAAVDVAAVDVAALAVAAVGAVLAVAGWELAQEMTLARKVLIGSNFELLDRTIESVESEVR